MTTFAVQRHIISSLNFFSYAEITLVKIAYQGLFNGKCSESDFITVLKFKGMSKVILLVLATKVKCNLKACNDYTTFEHRGTENY